VIVDQLRAAASVDSASRPSSLLLCSGLAGSQRAGVGSRRLSSGRNGAQETQPFPHRILSNTTVTAIQRVDSMRDTNRAAAPLASHEAAPRRSTSADSSHAPIQKDPPHINTTVVHSARFWNYLLGGKDNYAVDRQAAEQILVLVPSLRDTVRAERGFLARAVRYLAGSAGIHQFLDIGTGLPSANNTHEIAQATAPESRVVYVDNDPLIMAHARALLTSTPEGATDYVHADLCKPDTILQEAARTLDFTQPVGLMLLGILNFIPDTNEAHTIVNRLLAALPSGSYLVISHPTAEIDGEAMKEAMRLWNQSGAAPIVARSRQQLIRFFDSLELLDPGVVSCSLWRPDHPEIGAPVEVFHFSGVGRKP
jgi:S-adenosyl methyltransferase